MSVTTSAVTLGIAGVQMIGLSRTQSPSLFDRVKANRDSNRLDAALDCACYYLLLETCERLELYLIPKSAERFNRIFRENFAVWNRRAGIDAVTHFLSVATGLESRIVGEKHIRQQVRRAVLHHLEQETLGPVLSKLGQMAIHIPRLVSAQTQFGAKVLEIDDLAIREVMDFRTHAKSPKNDFHSLIVGTGCLGRRIARNLNTRTSQITITSRDSQRAEALAAELGAQHVHLSRLPETLDRYDSIFVVTQSRDFVLHSPDWPQDTRRRIVFDLSVPRAVDPTLSQYTNVILHDLESLASQANKTVDGQHIAERLIAEAIEKLKSWDAFRRELFPNTCELASDLSRKGIAA